jgi:fumarate reductase flavoprotein subunit
MIKKHTGFEYGKDLYSIRVADVDGDGIRMAWDAGAAPTDMIMELLFGLPMDVPPVVPSQPWDPDEKRPERHPVASYVFCQAENLIVDASGERFMDEEIAIRNISYAANSIVQQKHRYAFSIFDSATAKYWQENGFPYYGFSRSIPWTGDIDAELEKTFGKNSPEIYQKCARENIFVADSIEELADKLGINRDALKNTVAEYNEACETGRDEIFFKKARYLKSVKQPKFYAGKIVASAFGSLGGIRTNDKTEVLDKDNYDVIPGLFAAGTDANSINGDTYVFVFPGNTYGFALNSGRIAGENAARMILETK